VERQSLNARIRGDEREPEWLRELKDALRTMRGGCVGRVGTYRDKLRSAFDAEQKYNSQALDMTIAQWLRFHGKPVRRFVLANTLLSIGE